MLEIIKIILVAFFNFIGKIGAKFANAAYTLEYQGIRVFVNKSVSQLLRRDMVVFSIPEPEPEPEPLETIWNISCNDDGRLNYYEKDFLRLLQYRNFNSDVLSDVMLHVKGTDEGNNLALITPIPPERTGIADYSEELIAALSKHYKVYIISDIVNTPLKIINEKNICLRNIKWFEQNADSFDNNIVYQFGNSVFHTEMFKLLQTFPGVVVLHDIFIGDFARYLCSNQLMKESFTSLIQRNHGYSALQDYLNLAKTNKTNNFFSGYPCLFDIINSSTGIIVNSQYASDVIKMFYGEHLETHVTVANLVKNIVNVSEQDKALARKKLRIEQDDFIIATFGMITSRKGAIELISAFMDSKLRENTNVKLVFVGAIPESEYGDAFKTLSSSVNKNIVVTGYVTGEEYTQYLMAADVCVQLRLNSRGENSAAILDSMAYGKPVIANKYGPASSIDKDAICLIGENIDHIELVDVIEKMFADEKYRDVLAQNAINFVKNHNSSKRVASAFEVAINKSKESKKYFELQEIKQIVAQKECFKDCGISLLQEKIFNHEFLFRKKMVFVDVTTMCAQDLGTGIQRVVRNILAEFLKTEDKEYLFEPVYFKNGECYYARQYTTSFLKINDTSVYDEKINFQKGDIFLGLDWHTDLAYTITDVFERMKQVGVKVCFVVYDILPITLRRFFIETMHEQHVNWLNFIRTYSNQLICISNSVADDLKKYYIQSNCEFTNKIIISHFPLGCNIDKHTKGISDVGKQLLDNITKKKYFLMVGTVEARKGHKAVLNAFEELWANNYDVSLVLVGKPGWKVEELIDKIKKHSLLNKKLFWLNNASDELLEALYKEATALIAASYGEGFGLPLIEAALHRRPLIVRDIPVFREVAGNFATYFSDDNHITDTIVTWLNSDDHPNSCGIRCYNWENAADILLNIIIKE